MTLKQIIFNILFLILSLNSFAQQIILSDASEISVITVAPGNELYDTFGHSAFRVKDKMLGLDQAYNYGIYNFNTPNFYGKFAQGKLPYDLASYPFHYFLRNYVEENRTIKEQQLNLTTAEKQLFFDFLENNAKPENKSYIYDFFYDNCATKLQVVTQKVLGKHVIFDNNFTKDKEDTLRDLIHQYSHKHIWGTFGIDLALGSVIDRKATTQEYLFLPDNIFLAFAESKLNNKPTVKKTLTLFTSTPKEVTSNFVTPFVLVSFIGILVLLITYRNFKNKKRSRWLDFTLFFITGLIGIVILLLWFATDHSTTKGNYNILWAFAPNLFVAFSLLKNKIPNWVKKYILLLLILLTLTVVLWVLKIQVFNIAIIPILLLLIIRYLFLYKSEFYLDK